MAKWTAGPYRLNYVLSFLRVCLFRVLVIFIELCCCRGLKQTSAIDFCENSANSNEKQWASLKGCCFLCSKKGPLGVMLGKNDWTLLCKISATLYKPAWIRWRGLFGVYSCWPIEALTDRSFLVWTWKSALMSRVERKEKKNVSRLNINLLAFPCVWLESSAFVLDVHIGTVISK